MDGALSDFDLALERAPDDTEVLYERALLLMGSGRWDEAARDFSVILKVDSNSPLGHLGMGAYHLQIEDYPSAKVSLSLARDMAEGQGYPEVVEQVDQLLTQSRLK